MGVPEWYWLNPAKVGMIRAETDLQTRLSLERSKNYEHHGACLIGSGISAVGVGG